MDSINTLGISSNVKSVAITYTPTTVGDQAVPIVAALAGKKVRVYSWGASLSINGSNCYMRDSTGVRRPNYF